MRKKSQGLADNFRWRHGAPVFNDTVVIAGATIAELLQT